jgi:hypothetical protein
MARKSFLGSFFGKSVIVMVLAIGVAFVATELKMTEVTNVSLTVFLLAAVVSVFAFFFRLGGSRSKDSDKSEANDVEIEQATQQPRPVKKPAQPVMRRRRSSGLGKAMARGAFSALMGDTGSQTSKCRYCGSNSYGIGCAYSPHGKHEHI